MGLPLLPPKTEPLVDDDKFTTLFWLSFLEEVASGDAGTVWTPTFVGLSSTGTPTITGKYYRISKILTFYRIVITPATNTSAVNGTTYCDNFPLTIASDGFNITCSGFTAATSGTTAIDKRIYAATWTNITTSITIIGIAETS